MCVMWEAEQAIRGDDCQGATFWKGYEYCGGEGNRRTIKIRRLNFRNQLFTQQNTFVQYCKKRQE